MSAAYKPGTVAEIGWAMTSGRERALFDGDVWHTESGVTVGRPTDVRPLVVIDPEALGMTADGMVNHLRWLARHTTPEASFDQDKMAHASSCGKVAQLADAIEAQTKPPRIPEPGWGSIVQSNGVRWVRGKKGWTNLDADGTYLNWRTWDDLLDPVLIRDGVEDGAS